MEASDFSKAARSSPVSTTEKQPESETESKADNAAASRSVDVPHCTVEHPTELSSRALEVVVTEGSSVSPLRDLQECLAKLEIFDLSLEKSILEPLGSADLTRIIEQKQQLLKKISSLESLEKGALTTQMKGYVWKYKPLT